MIFEKYSPDDDTLSLDSVIANLEEIKQYDDVREYLIPKYRLREALINSKLL